MTTAPNQLWQTDFTYLVTISMLRGDPGPSNANRRVTANAPGGIAGNPKWGIFNRQLGVRRSEWTVFGYLVRENAVKQRVFRNQLHFRGQRES